MKNGHPETLVIHCNWQRYSPLHQSIVSKQHDSVRFILSVRVVRKRGHYRRFCWPSSTVYESSTAMSWVSYVTPWHWIHWIHPLFSGRNSGHAQRRFRKGLLKQLKLIELFNWVLTELLGREDQKIMSYFTGMYDLQWTNWYPLISQ